MCASWAAHDIILCLINVVFSSCAIHEYTIQVIRCILNKQRCCFWEYLFLSLNYRILLIAFFSNTKTVSVDIFFYYVYTLVFHWNLLFSLFNFVCMYVYWRDYYCDIHKFGWMHFVPINFWFCFCRIGFEISLYRARLESILKIKI